MENAHDTETEDDYDAPLPKHRKGKGKEAEQTDLKDNNANEGTAAKPKRKQPKRTAKKK